MGAFGELLIQYWGGDVDKYQENQKKETKKKLTKKPRSSYDSKK